LENWRVLPFQIFNAFENMAMDEALFRVLQERDGPPTLRFYGWQRPALSIGYFQDARQEVNLQHCREHGVDIVRRPTGGKAVLHDQELTYSVVSKEAPPFFCADLIGNYQAICSCLILGFSELGIEVSMAKDHRFDRNPDMDSICFACPAPFELLSRGRKICGSAQVRSHGCFLQHGSILLDFDAEKNCLLLLSSAEESNSWCNHLGQKVTSIHGETDKFISPEMLSGIVQRAFETTWCIRFVEGKLTREEEALKNDLLQRKYANPDWNLRGKVPKGLATYEDPQQESSFLR
jgi:lipoyl(octanoyl) transferase